MLISAQNIGLSFLDEVILQNVSLEVEDKDRIGLLGINGAGKTTLLNILAGRLEPDNGQLVRMRNLSVGYLQQNDALVGSHTLQEEARSAFAKTYAVRDEMKQCYQKLEQDPENSALLLELDRLTARFESMDGYSTDAKIARVLQGLGFGGFALSTEVATLSGGEKMRFAIAKMLLQEPDLLILDEPTNHLDFTMLAWLEEYLQEYKGAVLVVSHDRYFLDAVAKDVCEIERHELSRYKGGYSSFVLQKADRRKVALRAWEKQQEEIEKMEEYVRKNLARSASASSVGSRVKALEKMERIPKPPAEPKTISLRFVYDVEPFSLVLKCEGLGVYVGDEDTGKQLYSNLTLEVRRGEKVALVGPNGVGKSTFLKAVQGLIQHSGRSQWGGNVKIGYFDQELAGLNPEDTVLESVHKRYPTKTEFEIRSALGRLLLEGETVYKKVKELSGAMRAKVAFTILQMQRANVLVLDEPTNHLDYKAKEVLEQELNRFEGTLLVVSHDRYFLRKVPTRILELQPEGFLDTPGNYDDYLAVKAGQEPPPKEEKTEVPAKRTATKPFDVGAMADGHRSKEQRAADAQRRNRIAALEKEIAYLEQQAQEQADTLANPPDPADYEGLAGISEALAETNAKLESCMEEWVELTEIE